VVRSRVRLRRTGKTNARPRGFRWPTAHAASPTPPPATRR
jgi:hypothetical protein